MYICITSTLRLLNPRPHWATVAEIVAENGDNRIAFTLLCGVAVSGDHCRRERRL